MRGQVGPTKVRERSESPPEVREGSGGQPGCPGEVVMGRVGYTKVGEESEKPLGNSGGVRRSRESP